MSFTVLFVISAMGILWLYLKITVSPFFTKNVSFIEVKKLFVDNSKYNKQHIIENQSLPKNVISSEYHEYFKLYNIKENIITDKAPQNFRLIGFIKLFFPNCKIIHSAYSL